MFIIIRGPAGVGKTTVASLLAGTLAGVRIGVDDVLAVNGLDKVVGGCVPLENCMQANRLLLPKARSLLKEGRLVVIDGCFYHKDQLSWLLNRLQGPRLVVTLTAGLADCIKRNRERDDPLPDEAVREVYSLVRQVDFTKNVVVRAYGHPQEVADILLTKYLSKVKVQTRRRIR